jgi:hypothetical protein
MKIKTLVLCATMLVASICKGDIGWNLAECIAAWGTPVDRVQAIGDDSCTYEFKLPNRHLDDRHSDKGVNGSVNKWEHIYVGMQNGVVTDETSTFGSM